MYDVDAEYFQFLDLHPHMFRPMDQDMDPTISPSIHYWNSTLGPFFSLLALGPVLGMKMDCDLCFPFNFLSCSVCGTCV